MGITSRKNTHRVCNAYKCTEEATIPRPLDGTIFWFCKNHTNILNHNKSAVIMDVISSEKLNSETILRRFNFKNSGFTQQDLFSTIEYLKSIDEVNIVDGCYFITGYENNCEFYGCKLKKHKGYCYCSNHKNLPKMNYVDEVMNVIRNNPKNAAQIEFETNIDLKIVKSILFQLVKFGYTIKEKKGVTNYYIGR